MTKPGDSETNPQSKTGAPAPQSEREEQDDYLEEALEETFPASDPISPGHVPKR